MGIRLTASIYTSDPDELEVAQRLKPFNLASWVEEWTRVAEKNEKLAEKFAGEGYSDGQRILFAGVELLPGGLLADAGYR